MKIVVSGGTGFIGKPLCRSLSASGHDVILLTRQSNVQLTSTGTHVRVVHWDGMTRGPWEYALNGADAVMLHGGGHGNSAKNVTNCSFEMDTWCLHKASRICGCNVQQ